MSESQKVSKSIIRSENLALRVKKSKTETLVCGELERLGTQALWFKNHGLQGRSTVKTKAQTVPLFHFFIYVRLHSF